MSEANDTPHGWLFLAPGAVPERWKGRSRPAELIPLDVEEAASVLRTGATEPEVEDEDAQLMHLVAQGLSARVIAHRIGRSERSVHRRLAALRARYRVPSTSELISELSRRGF